MIHAKTATIGHSATNATSVKTAQRSAITATRFVRNVNRITGVKDVTVAVLVTERRYVRDAMEPVSFAEIMISVRIATDAVIVYRCV